MKKFKPTTASRRQMTVADYSTLSSIRPLKSLTMRLQKHAGRNSQGRITVRHQGGGNKTLYRIVDFVQGKSNIPARVTALEYDPYRTAFIARIVYRNGSYSYILAPHGVKVGDTLVAGDTVPLTLGNRTQLKRIPVGTFVYNIELLPGQGGKLARSAGASIQVLAHEDGYAHLKLLSGEIRKVPWNSYASIGQVSNPENNLVVIGKAGRSRWLGIRPTVRGTVMNPVDHPYGGGEGRQPRGTKRPKTLWGKVTGGRKTRNRKKWSNKLIMKRRK